jgi:beta-lactamase regulating signal transducer with metallopeptidase domain
MQLHAISAALTWSLGDSHGGLSAAFAQFARTASPVALDAMWQGAAVAIILFISLRLAPRVSAAHRFAAWTAGFAAVASLPFLPVAAHFFSSPAAAVAVAGAASSPRPWFEFDDRWALAIAALWLIASAFRFSQLVFHAARLRRLWKTATPVADDSILSSKGLPHAVVVCTTKELDRPSVIGFFAPRILIPEWLYARLTPQELKQVVLHEVEHLRRHDDWTNLIQKFVLVLFPLNPALAWIERRSCREREMACDEGVVEKTQAPRAYAACLASLAGHGLDREMTRRAEELSLAAWRRRPELVHRVHGILSRKPALNLAASRVLLGIVGSVLLVGSVELARSPQVVGFATPQSEQIARLAPLPGALRLDRVAYAPSGAAALAQSEAGFHVVQAKAVLPASRNAAMNAAATQTRSAAARPSAPSAVEVASRDAVVGTPHETLLKAEMPASAKEPGATADSEAPQYLVLTAYERVQYVPQNSREIADYDTGATNAQPAAVGSKPAAAPAPQITITRLIFRIAPAGTPPGDPTASTKGATASPNQASPSKTATSSHAVHQPAIIPFGNGWLVFQL